MADEPFRELLTCKKAGIEKNISQNLKIAKQVLQHLSSPGETLHHNILLISSLYEISTIT